MKRRPKKNEPVKPRELHDCYVCGRRITGEPVYIPASLTHPGGLWRHIRCAPGGDRWMKSEHGKASALRAFYERGEGE